MGNIVNRGNRSKTNLEPHIRPDVVNKREKSRTMAALQTQQKSLQNLLIIRNHRRNPSILNDISTCNLKCRMMGYVYSEILASKAILGIRIVPVGLTVLLKLCFSAFC